MNIEEAINSSDREIVELAANLYFQKEGRDAVIELMKKSLNFQFSHIYKDVVYISMREVINERSNIC